VNFLRAGRFAENLSQLTGAIEKRQGVWQESAAFFRQGLGTARAPRLAIQLHSQAGFQCQKTVPYSLFRDVQHGGRFPQRALSRQLHESRYLIGGKRQVFGHDGGLPENHFFVDETKNKQFFLSKLSF
jgi:hypothetical protein